MTTPWKNDAQRDLIAGMLAKGLSADQVSETLGGTPSDRTLRRWAAHPEMVSAVDRCKTAASAAAPKPAPPPSTKGDFGAMARQAVRVAYNDLVARRNRGEDVPLGELLKLADALRKFDEEDTEGASPKGILRMLVEKPALAEGVLAEADARTAELLLQAARNRQLADMADLHLDDANVAVAFRVTGRVAPPSVAAEWTAGWNHMLKLARADLDKKMALAAHERVARVAGDEPDLGCVHAQHPVDVKPVLDAALAALGETP